MRLSHGKPWRAANVRSWRAAVRRRLASLAAELNLEHRVFSLADPAAVDAGLRDVTAVLNCAGPFSHTALPLADACLRTKTHYLDITGEIAVFESGACGTRKPGPPA